MTALPEDVYTSHASAKTRARRKPPHILRDNRFPPQVRLVLNVLSLAGALVIGIASAEYTLDRDSPFEIVRAGPWEAHPLAGTTKADPYSIARYARQGRIPLGSGEGVAFTTQTDSLGSRLNPSCSYEISGETPSARLWTLTATDGNGHLVATVDGRSSISSTSLLRATNGSFVITTSQAPQPGNWLPVGPGSRGMQLTMRLYDAPVATGSTVSQPVMPRILRKACR